MNKDALVGYIPTGWPNIWAFSACQSSMLEIVPFLASNTFICVVVKPTDQERDSAEHNKDTYMRNSSGRAIFAVGWLIENYQNVKIFTGTRKGCCCPSRIRNVKMVYSKGEDFDCGDGFSLITSPCMV